MGVVASFMADAQTSEAVKPGVVATGQRGRNPSPASTLPRSVRASIRACFINRGPVEKRNVFNSDWRSRYRGDFGGRIDGVGPGAC
ncbi:hypothetical protein [Streptomyces sp. A1499]|uniref:hypothetical protein n=1 Tax=Streptomyces sp. A1499 TaxID=2563104 RepID=UPI001F0F3FDD|nr:hypothetical protein [Streptomyces sp. A1499]